MFDKEGYKAYVGSNSGGSYASGLENIEKTYSVDIDAEIQKDYGTHLLGLIETDKKKMTGNDRHNRQNWYSHLKKYISYKAGQAITNVAWMPFYSELAEQLLAYKTDRLTMLSMLHKLFHDIGLKSPFVEKNDPMTDVDPFSVFGCFNKGISNANRVKILHGFKQAFCLQEAVPTNFDGVPVLNNLMAFFFAFKDDSRRGPEDIDNLWDLFSRAIHYADEPSEYHKNRFIKAFDLVKEQFAIRWNITMGLFWIRPYSFINLDERNRDYLGMGKAFPPVDTMIASKLKNIPTGTEYLDIIEACKNAFQHSGSQIRDFVELSKQAWIATTASGDEKKALYWPTVEEYAPGISKDTWKTMLQDPSITDGRTLDILRMILKLGGESTLTNLVKVYDNQFYYAKPLSEFGWRVSRSLGIPLCEGKYKAHARYLIAFQGRTVIEDGAEKISWKLRKELAETLEDMGMNDLGDDSMTDVGLNTILYGPPGTGKTYHTVIYAVAIIENRELASVAQEDYMAVLERYNDYKDQGRIEFTTFHQSYGYEEFIEGIRPAIIDEGEQADSGNIQYSVQPGIFKKFCEKAAQPIAVRTTTNDMGIRDNATIWKVSLWSTGDNEVRTECLKNEHIRIGWDQYGKDITDETDFSEDGGRVVLNAFMNKMQIGDIVMSCYSASTIDAIGIVTGEYEWHDEYHEFKRLRKVNWIIKNICENILEINGGTAMTLASVYRLSNIAISDVYKLIEKYKPTTLLPAKRNENYVFIIDEINRGNISKIFGELITLIEESKRIGLSESMKAVLPYSQKSFGVPENVYIIGTMNTADRSIATIDTALRRRFHFKEMMPRPDVLKDITVEGLSISDMLDRMNRRIAVLYDREHTIGHAYFVPLKDNPTIETLSKIFTNNIIPLLQEYFYEDYEKIRLVLGDNRKSDEEHQFIIARENDYSDLFGDVDVGLDDGRSYDINYSAFSHIEAYKSI